MGLIKYIIPFAMAFLALVSCSNEPSLQKYKTLIKFGSNNRGATLNYLGEEDAIDEVIVFASDNEKGFAVFRLLGENMRPDQMIKLMSSIDNGDLDLSKFSGIGELLDM